MRVPTTLRETQRRRLSRPHVESLELRLLLSDFGDAPDTGAGTGRGNYNTSALDGGPSHVVTNTIHLGVNVTDEANASPNARANGDAADDGLVNPIVDLALTVGAQPTVTLRATNKTGASATITGWIDYNADGVFDNVTERAQVAVPNGAESGVFRLVFPATPGGYTGTTYARFRISTDIAGGNPIGAAIDGEVEDYQVSIAKPGGGAIKPNGVTQIGSIFPMNGGPLLVRNNQFGSSVASLGDLDGDGITDLAVGASGDEAGGEAYSSRGAVYILFMNANGTVKSFTKIASDINGGPGLADLDKFGDSITNLGDLDRDGVVDIAVGAPTYIPTGSTTPSTGSVFILFLNANGSVKSSTKIARDVVAGLSLAHGDFFGCSVENIGDINGDGVVDLAVGAFGADAPGENLGLGAVYVILLNSDGTARSSRMIGNNINGGPDFFLEHPASESSRVNSFHFGSTLVNLGDINQDGLVELAVGESHHSDIIGDSIYILSLTPDGSAASHTRIVFGTGGTSYWYGVSFIGDANADGIRDLALGDFDQAQHSGVFLINSSGAVQSRASLPTIPVDYRLLINNVVNVGDIDGDGIVDLAYITTTGPQGAGSVFLVRQAAGNSAPDGLSFSSSAIPDSLGGAAFVGTFSASDPDPGGTFSFALVTGQGDDDNDLFVLAGPDLKTKASFRADKMHYSVRVRTTDAGGLSFEKSFVMTVIDIPSARFYRAYNPAANYHFFTTSIAEFNVAVAAGYRDETVGQSGFDVMADDTTGGLPIYRLYNLQTGRHYYTYNPAERDYLVNIVPAPTSGPDTRVVGWRYEKIDGYIYNSPRAGTSEIFRLYNSDSGVHLYTENASVRDAVLLIEEQVNGVSTGRHPWQLHSSFGYAYIAGAVSGSSPAATAIVLSSPPAPASAAAELPSVSLMFTFSSPVPVVGTDTVESRSQVREAVCENIADRFVGGFPSRPSFQGAGVWREIDICAEFVLEFDTLGGLDLFWQDESRSRVLDGVGE